MTFERVVFLPDPHCPYEDGDAVRTALAFIRSFQPHVLFLLGDVVDFYQLSNFDKDPARKPQLWDDIMAAHMFLEKVRKAAGNIPIYYIQGNHEFRLQRYLWRVADVFASLPSLSVPKLLSLDEFNIKYVEKGWMFYHNILVKHGNIVRAKSGYTATGEMEKTGRSGVSGHTHRLSQIYKTDYSGMWTWVESGCLCKLDAEYLEGQIANWQLGLSYGYIRPSGRFSLHTLPIIKNSVIWEGKEITI